MCNFRGVHNGHEQTYNWVCQFFKDLDFAETAKRLGFTLLSDTEMAIDFLGRNYKIDSKGIELYSEKIIWQNSDVTGFNIKSILGYYALSKCNVIPGSDFAPLGSFSSGVFSNSSSWNSAAAKSVQDAFKNGYQTFSNVAEKLGMLFKESRGSGKYLWSYTLLPKIPVQIAYYEGDEDFPSNIITLFDKSAISVLNFEQLAVLSSCLTSAMCATGQMEK
ncbi:MAG: DUF3786 domain-containing protein [Spirochaetaceae bacterium]|jgi:hypothetical protein|nr:DUF3786 domain-containing protein [Spirochaetaceae bacterium]